MVMPMGMFQIIKEQKEEEGNIQNNFLKSNSLAPWKMKNEALNGGAQK